MATMTGFPHCSLLQAKKTWSRFICFPCFESSLHGPYLAVKRRLIYQTLFENLKPFSSFWGQFTCEPHWQPNMATMTGFPQCSLLQAKKTWTRFICFPCSESSLHGPHLAVKRRLIYQTLWNVTITVTWTPGKENGYLAQKAKWYFWHLCAHPAVQAQCSCFIILLPTSVQRLELWIPETTEISVLKFCIHQARLFIYGDFWFLNLKFLGYQGSLWT